MRTNRAAKGCHRAGPVDRVRVRNPSIFVENG
jgi:hypothetical protein